MIELTQVPRSAFFWALRSNLRHPASLSKLYRHFTKALRFDLEADSVWVYRCFRHNRSVDEWSVEGDDSICDAELNAAFVREEKPSLPRHLLLSPLEVHGRLVGVAGAARRSQDFSRGGYHIEGRFQPCDALGGDFYLAVLNRDGSVSCALSDIVGHGVGAAMYAGMLRSLLDTARRIDPAPRAVARELLRGIDFFEDTRYGTLFYAQLLPDGRMRYFNAGHPPAFWRAGRRETRELSSTGFFLSPILPKTEPEVREVTLSPGDRILLFTDGIYEVMNPSDEQLEREAIAQCLEDNDSAPAEGILQHTLDRVSRHAAGRPLDDDATLLLVQRDQG